ncbi:MULTISPECIES: N-acetylneuraminate synthase family protein [Nitrosomonas]|uniref:N-acetylneuraminate synthase n=2 Tax=Nitrosomonas eutropha TaxID=916 RepID=A0ABX5M975_9PROT|nr:MULTISPECIES: N-acetylneuraminate synthase family protein [Nitrosomonas]ABI59793.1 N-acetylneuraminate synthase [Nitrosomonas eutropha C91]MXS80290.1 CBS domain-containing protein [Nitrosomonas sp. GH22]PXV83618.1 N-acetylneuraminate synthase [Nitrosomonas eutropha]SCX00131.1 N-acetylneuraminate synthase [Nitrosomonas eutropha]SDW31853.1 N-acetylneuraminate synthase [Nitrosomonas eutropha]
MRIEKRIKDYLVFSGDSILDALKHINDNQSRIVFVVQDNGVLIGAVSDGDVRRWMTQATEFDLNLPIDHVMNRNFIARPVAESQNQIADYFDHKRDIIPLIDEQGRFVALARKSATGLQIGDFLIADQNPTFIIAEVGNNHNGDIGLAKELVNLAVEAGADCVKFQMRDLSSLYSNQGRNAEVGYDLGSQYTLDLLNKFQLSHDALCQIFDYCRQQDILPLCTPWDMVSVRVLEEYGLEAFKVASADFTNYEMLEALAKTGKPLICSTGMSSEAEIKGSVSLLRRLGAPFALLHCNSTYPAPFKDVNLNYLPHLKQLAGTVVGYSGHERGFAVPLAAVALGARIVEKHFTVNRGMEGNDHKVSLLPAEFTEMVQQIRNIEEAMGQGGERALTQGEMINRENLAKSLVINCDLSQGQLIKRSMIVVKSPGQGLQPNRIDELAGKVAQHDFKAGDFFFETDITPQSAKKQHYTFSRPYGIPARYHDYQALTEGMKIDFIEFHLSYHDLDVKLSDYFSDPLPIGYAVHSPELFAGDHILDLANDDEDYRAHSITELKRTTAVASELRQYFPSTPRPVLVLNAGGWSPQNFLPVEARTKLYDRVAKALGEIDLNSIRLAIQTMPPFPWHFGGQSHHNLFVDPDEIAVFCEKTGHHICLDVSHSMMACNYYQWDFSAFLKKVLPHTIHLHIVDAKGIDGEGVQIGHGDVDFALLHDQLNQHAPGIQFIPEIWQGHKNKGEGFWSALAFLEKTGF